MPEAPRLYFSQPVTRSLSYLNTCGGEAHATSLLIPQLCHFQSFHPYTGPITRFSFPSPPYLPFALPPPCISAHPTPLSPLHGPA